MKSEQKVNKLLDFYSKPRDFAYFSGEKPKILNGTLSIKNDHSKFKSQIIFDVTENTQKNTQKSFKYESSYKKALESFESPRTIFPQQNQESSKKESIKCFTEKQTLTDQSNKKNYKPYSGYKNYETVKEFEPQSESKKKQLSIKQFYDFNGQNNSENKTKSSKQNLQIKNFTINSSAVDEKYEMKFNNIKSVNLFPQSRPIRRNVELWKQSNNEKAIVEYGVKKFRNQDQALHQSSLQKLYKEKTQSQPKFT